MNKENNKNINKKRILMCFQSAEYGGVEKQILDIIECESKYYDIHVMTPNGPLVDEYLKAGAVEHVNLSPRAEFDLLYSYKVYKYCKNNNIKVVHGHELKAGALSTFGAFWARVPKRIYHVHTPFVEWKHSELKKFFAQSVNLVVNWIVANMFSTHVLALTESIRETRVNKEHVFSKKIVVIPNGVVLDKFKFDQDGRKKIRKKYKMGEADFVFGYVARLTEEKGHKYLLGAFKEFKNLVNNGHDIKNLSRDVIEKIKNSKLLFAGGGKLEKEIENLIKKYDLVDSVIVTGRFEEEDKIPLYSSFDVFTFASYAEGFGIVLIEAMKMGLPSIVSDIPVLHDVGGDAVLYAKPDDVNMWKSKMVDLISDSDLRNQLSANAIRQAQKFSMKKFCENYKNLYA